MRHHHSPHQPRFGDGFDRAGRWQRDGSQGPEGRDDFGSERRGRSGDPRAHGGRPGGGRGRRGPEGFGPADRGPDGFDPRGFGPDGKGPGGFGTDGPGRHDDPRDGGFGPHGGGRGGGRGRRGGPDRRGRGPHRAPRGDVRTAVLLLLAEEPMHGYQLMQTITERTGSRWRPSPGAIYPTISQLEDEGLVITEKSGGRKLASLTEAGHAHVEENSSTWADPFPAAAQSADDEVIDLRELAHGLLGAVREMARTGSDEQVRQAAVLLEETRRGLYTILAGPSAAQSADPSADDPS
ncbi:PadR family transcriptional regulator [Brachybacterium alimentarium]|uniref:Transcription regulator PadR N-terminal domain-containing protein n=2 Tax=Brachybacterium TaxID=43668 RepID=A0A2A3YMK2_9MICO|nr:PadR family transcriptional regulator [Brachybacterium alimentarium]PCC40518.1 hypothetical protein CIK66_01660 [Brachybacterium alimentarium]RCS67433.1 PadR family transcriptional regulator [Brachybacterium alimentarium]RCS87629.1 PadR family transcriptional regulator [Brachybacterium alimentarium]